MIGPPQLADDFRRGQVAIKALMPRGAKAAVDRTTGLAGHAQRTARGFGNVHGFHRIALPHVSQPFARAVGRDVIAQNRRQG